MKAYWIALYKRKIGLIKLNERIFVNNSFEFVIM